MMYSVVVVVYWNSVFLFCCYDRFKVSPSILIEININYMNIDRENWSEKGQNTSMMFVIYHTDRVAL